MRKLFTLVAALGFSSSVFAQAEGSAFTSTGRAVSTTFAKDYESIDINPANLAWGTGWEGTNFTLGIAEFGASAFSNGMTKDQLRGKKVNELFTKEKALQAFSGSGTSFNIDVAPLNFAYMNEKMGGFAVNTKDRAQFFAKLGDQAADILVNGFGATYFDSIRIQDAGGGNEQTVANDPSYYNNSSYEILAGFANEAGAQLISELLDGTEINLSWTREYNISYGRYLVDKDLIKIGGGLGLKYIQGFGIVSVGTDKDGKLQAFSSLSDDFGIDVSGQTSPNSNWGAVPFFKPVGSGVGVDLGFNAVLGKKLHLGLAANNIGSMKWKGNAFSVKDTLFTEIESGGFESFNLVQELQTIASDGGLFDFQPQNSLTVALPSTFRMGASLDLKKNTIHVGADVVIPLNDVPGNFEQPIVGLGGDFRIIKNFEIELGMQYGGNTQERLNVPIGLTFHAGKSSNWEAGVASRDMVTWFRENAPNLSAAFGFMRFRF